MTRLLAAGLLAAAALACTASAPHYLAPGHEGAPGVRRVLLCPANLSLGLHPEIARGVEPVETEVVAYLEARGLEVDRLDRGEARRRWQEAAAEARQASKAPGPLFTRALAAEREFHVLLIPSLLLRQVRVSDSGGTWDGVRRSMKMVNVPSRGHGDSADTFTKGVAFGGIEADVMAASLHVIAYSTDGQRVFEARGGLDFVQEIDLADVHGGRWQLRTKEWILRDPEAVREGVEVALSPYLPARAPR